MKILIAYYSRSRTTKKLAEIIEKEFEKRGHSVDVEKIKPIREHSFLGWVLIRAFYFLKGDCEIYRPTIKNVSKYDAICIGSPNWARLSLPVTAYLKEIEGLKHKKVGFFATTALQPTLEWYVFSAYWLCFTFSSIIEKKGGRIIDSILLSGLFKKWSVESEYGENAVKNFCDKIEISIDSFKEYFLKEKEVQDARAIVVLLSTFLCFSFVFQAILYLFGVHLFSWNQYFFLFISNFSALLLMLALLEGKTKIFLGKYITGAFLAVTITLVILFLSPNLGRPIISGYILLFVLLVFFREPKVIVFTGIIVFSGYIFLLYNHPADEVLRPVTDIGIIFLSVAVISVISQNFKKHFVGVLEAQDEIEMARVNLEKQVFDRTKKLKELTENLEEKVKKRTAELQIKNKEFERKNRELEEFNDLAVGRELRMFELKEEIERLKKNG